MRHLFALLLVVMMVVGRAADAAAGDKPIWLLGNDFHTSIVFRARDVPFRKEITDAPASDELAIGWGASADYRGPSTPWTVMQALFPNKGAIHVAPIAGPITRRFPGSDVVLMWLKPEVFDRLTGEIEQSFAWTRDHHPIFLARGYYPDSRFYKSSERFYFPYVCSMWVAIKLTHAGAPFFLPRAILSNSLILQAARKGVWLQRHDDGRFEAY